MLRGFIRVWSCLMPCCVCRILSQIVIASLGNLKLVTLLLVGLFGLVRVIVRRDFFALPLGVIDGLCFVTVIRTFLLFYLQLLL